MSRTWRKHLHDIENDDTVEIGDLEDLIYELEKLLSERYNERKASDE